MSNFAVDSSLDTSARVARVVLFVAMYTIKQVYPRAMRQKLFGAIRAAGWRHTVSLPLPAYYVAK
eukprot:1810163-Pleurochrysis_carterae.AAC.2